MPIKYTIHLSGETILPSESRWHTNWYTRWYAKRGKLPRLALCLVLFCASMGWTSLELGSRATGLAGIIYFSLTTRSHGKEVKTEKSLSSGSHLCRVLGGAEYHPKRRNFS